MDSIYIWNKPSSVLAATFLEATKETNVRDTILSETDWSKKINPKYSFLRQILHTWAKFNCSEQTDTDQVQQEILWNNDFIKLEKRFSHWKIWKFAGIYRINDLLHNTDATFLTHEEIIIKSREEGTQVQRMDKYPQDPRLNINNSDNTHNNDTQDQQIINGQKLSSSGIFSTSALGMSDKII